MDNMWKRKRRKPGYFIKYLFISFGILFCIGNVAFLRDGILELTKELRHPTDNHPDIELAVNEKIELPLSALSHQTRLRHLMNNNGWPVDSHQTSRENNSSIFLEPEQLKQTLFQTSECNKVKFNLDNNSFIAAGWTKAVYKGYIQGKPVAIKTVHKNGYDASKCLSDINTKNVDSCYVVANTKILRETALLEGLIHPNVIKVRLARQCCFSSVCVKHFSNGSMCRNSELKQM